MPLESASLSEKPVQTCCPFLPITIAVPVSWHIGRTPFEDMTAFFSISRATNLSLPELSGSSNIFASSLRCDDLIRWDTSLNDCSARSVSPSGAIFNISVPSNDFKDTCS